MTAKIFQKFGLRIVFLLLKANIETGEIMKKLKRRTNSF